MAKNNKPLINKETNERFCYGCEKWFPMTREYWNFYKGGIRNNYHKACYYARSKSKQPDLEKMKVLQEPYKYKNDFQKNETHKFLKSIGWFFNEELNHWWKEPYVNEQGVWNLPEGTEKPGTHELTPEERLEIREKYIEKGFDVRQVMSEYNVTRAKIRSAIMGNPGRNQPGRKPDIRRLRHPGGTLVPEIKNRKMPYRERMTKEEIEELMKLYHQGIKVPGIAAMINRTETAVRYQIKKLTNADNKE